MSDISDTRADLERLRSYGLIFLCEKCEHWQLGKGPACECKRLCPCSPTGAGTAKERAEAIGKLEVALRELGL